MSIKSPLIVILLYLLVSSSLIGCDPGRVLIIKAENKPNVSIKIFATKNILPDEKGNEKIIIDIPGNDLDPHYEIKFDYGLGTWSKDIELDSLSKNIDSIIIQNTDETIRLSDEGTIKNYLLNHLSGSYGGSILTIEAK